MCRRGVDIPVELIDDDGTKGFFAMLSACGFYLSNGVRERGDAKGEYGRVRVLLELAQPTVP